MFPKGRVTSSPRKYILYSVQFTVYTILMYWVNHSFIADDAMDSVLNIGVTSRFRPIDWWRVVSYHQVPYQDFRHLITIYTTEYNQFCTIDQTLQCIKFHKISFGGLLFIMGQTKPWYGGWGMILHNIHRLITLSYQSLRFVLYTLHPSKHFRSDTAIPKKVRFMFFQVFSIFFWLWTTL